MRWKDCSGLAWGVMVWVALLVRFQTVFAQEIHRTLWVEPERVDLSDPRVPVKLLSQPIQRLVLSCFVGGQTLFPTKSNLFRQMARYQGKGDVLKSILTQASQNGIEVYAFMDCLRWSRPGVAKEQDIFEKHPELAERDSFGGYGRPTAGRYASPFHPKVRKELTALVDEIATRYPRLHGLLLQCRLPLGPMLGYSEMARVAYIREKQIDPVDILSGGSEEDMKVNSEWTAWRLEMVSQLVKELSRVFKARNQQGRIAVIGYANWYRISWGKRNITLEDWLNWALLGYADEVLLECPWDQNMRAYRSAKLLIDKVKKPIKATVLLKLRGRNKRKGLIEQLRALQGQGEISGVVVLLSDQQDLPFVRQFLEKELPRMEQAVAAGKPP